MEANKESRNVHSLNTDQYLVDCRPIDMNFVKCNCWTPPLSSIYVPSVYLTSLYMYVATFPPYSHIRSIGVGEGIGASKEVLT